MSQHISVSIGNGCTLAITSVNDVEKICEMMKTAVQDAKPVRWQYYTPCKRVYFDDVKNMIIEHKYQKYLRMKSVYQSSFVDSFGINHISSQRPEIDSYRTLYDLIDGSGVDFLMMTYKISGGDTVPLMRVQ